MKTEDVFKNSKDILIELVYDSEDKLVCKDIRVIFPDEEPISFMEVGLINACTDIEEDKGREIVKIPFLGTLVETVEEEE